MQLGRANLEVFADTLLALARQDRDILIVTSDSRGSGKLVEFGQQLPDQIVEVGIAEQNLVGICAGMASAGKRVYGVSPASFLTARGLEQIKNDVAYSDHPVKLVGISAGVSYGALGSTHHSLHDFAALRAINNVDIVVPADNFETQQAIKASVRYERPLYIRFGKRQTYHLYADDTPFEIGRAIVLREGSDITFVATGEPLVETLMAADLLTQQGISCGVISMHTLKPLDAAAILSVAERTRALVTVEEHSVSGGLGEAVASLLIQAGIMLPFKIVGFPDEYMVNGSQSEIFRHYGISPQGLAETALELLSIASRA